MSAESNEEQPELLQNKNHTRYKKRQWEFYEKRQNGESDAKKTCDGEKVERIKRKKMAMLLGYCGVDYYGMQRYVYSLGYGSILKTRVYQASNPCHKFYVNVAGNLLIF